VICVLVEVSQQDDISKIQQIWDLLSDLYSANATLSQLSEDRRRSHAAGMVLAAWKARLHKLGPGQCPQTPAFVTCLENQLREAQMETANKPSAGSLQQIDTTVQPARLEVYLPPEEGEPVFELDFQDIDWSFWSSID
jgi:hypothetical protein